MKKMQVIFIGILLSVTITSCSSFKEFEFVIENKTGYTLDSIQFSCAVNKHIQSVDSNSTTGPFFIKYKTLLLPLTEPLLCLNILKYSDSHSNYRNRYGIATSRSDLSRGKTNILIIELNPSPSHPTNIFNMNIKN